MKVITARDLRRRSKNAWTPFNTAGCSPSAEASQPPCWCGRSSDWKVVMSITSGPSAWSANLRLDFSWPRPLLHLHRSPPQQCPGGVTFQSVMFSDAAGVYPHLRLHRRHRVRSRHGAPGFRDSRGPCLPPGLAALRRPCLSVHDVHRDGGIHGRCPQQLTLCRGVQRRQLSRRAGRGGGQGADLAVPAGLHAHPAALHRPAGGASLRAGRVPVLAGGDVFRVLRALAGGPVGQTDRAVGLSGPRRSVAFQSVRLAALLLSGGMARLAGHPQVGFLGRHRSLFCLAVGLSLARIPDSVQLDRARILRRFRSWSAASRCGYFEQNGPGTASFRQRTRRRPARRAPDPSAGAVLASRAARPSLSAGATLSISSASASCSRCWDT